MAQPIKKSDIVENDILKSLIQEFEQAKIVTDSYNKTLKETATLLKSKLQNTKLNDTKSLQEFNMQMKESNVLFNQKLKLQDQENKNAIMSEKLKREQLRTQQAVNKAEETEIRNKTKLESVYARLNTKLGNLRKEYRDLAVRQELGLKLSEKEQQNLTRLETKITKYDGVLKKVDASMGNHQRNVGNYASGFNGLGNSINQLSREMPAFANSMQTGFMAISNNLPIFFDEIQKIKQANAELQKTGQPTTSILKQLGASVFSVGTALSIGVTLLTVYGAKLFDWIGSIGKGEKEVNKLVEANKRLAKEQKEGREYVADESAKYVGLIQALKQTNAGSKERAELIEKINSKFGTHLQNLKDETKFQNQLNNSVKEYLRYKEAEYIQKVNEDKIQILLEKKLKALQVIKDTENEINKSAEARRKMGYSDTGRDLKIELETYYTIIEERRKELDYIEKRLKTLGISNLEQEKILGSSNFNNEKNNIKANNNDKIQIEKDYLREIEDERTKAMQESLGRQQLEIYIRDTRRIEDLKKEVGNAKQKAILIKEIESNMIAEILKLEDDYYKEAERKRKEHMDYLSNQLDELDNEAYERGVKELEIQNKQRETNLLNSDANDKQVAKMTKQNQIDMLEQKIELAKKYDKDTTDLELELAKLRNEKISDVTKKNGINLINALIEAEIKASQKRIELIDKEIAKRQEQYNLYVELSKNGTIQAKESLALEQEAIVEANKKKALEMKRQERLKFAESAFTAYANNAEKGEKNPLLKTITDMTLLRQFISSMPSFKVGTEDTGSNGRGVDGEGGFHAILHPNERVLTKEQNQMIGSISNEELANTMMKVRSGQLINLHEGATAINSNWQTPIQLVNKIDELKEVIKNKPETNIQLGEITQHAMAIVESKRVGNTKYNNKYII